MDFYCDYHTGAIPAISSRHNFRFTVYLSRYARSMPTPLERVLRRINTGKYLHYHVNYSRETMAHVYVRLPASMAVLCVLRPPSFDTDQNYCKRIAFCSSRPLVAAVFFVDGTAPSSFAKHRDRRSDLLVIRSKTRRRRCKTRKPRFHYYFTPTIVVR